MLRFIPDCLQQFATIDFPWTGYVIANRRVQTQGIADGAFVCPLALSTNNQPAPNGRVEGSTAGLIGYGAIGSRVAGMLRGFGCQVLVYDPYVKPETLGNLAQNVELDELLSRSLIVSLHARATPETQGIIGAKQLAAMPAGSRKPRGSQPEKFAASFAANLSNIASTRKTPSESLPGNARIRGL